MRDIASLELPIGYCDLLRVILGKRTELGYKKERFCRLCGVILNNENKASWGDICLSCYSDKQREWRGFHQGYFRKYTKQREARERGGGEFPFNDWLAKLEFLDYKCAYCGQKTKDITCDHIIPLTRGGLNKIENLVPCCKSCNSKKHTKTGDEFRST